MFNNKNTFHNLLKWTDRFLPKEIREDPILHLRAQLALFLALPGGTISLVLVAHSSTLTTDGFSNLAPFMVGCAVALLCSLALTQRRTIKLGLHTMAHSTLKESGIIIGRSIYGRDPTSSHIHLSGSRWVVATQLNAWHSTNTSALCS